MNILDSAGNVIDPATSGAASGVTDDGEAVTDATKGVLLMGTEGGGGANLPGTARAINVDADGDSQVDVKSSALPSGAATEVTVAAIDITLGSPAQAGEVAIAIPDPATEAKQDSIITKLTREEKNPTALTQAVAAPGTREAFAATQQIVYFEVRAGKIDGVNAGNVYIGTNTVNKDTDKGIILFPGDTHRFVAPEGISTDLDAWFIDADNAGDGITGYYIPA